MTSAQHALCPGGPAFVATVVACQVLTQITWDQYMKVGLAITPPVLLAVLAAVAFWLPLVGQP